LPATRAGKELERENARLKRIVADQLLKNQALKEIAKGTLSPSRRRDAVLGESATLAGLPRARSNSALADPGGDPPDSMKTGGTLSWPGSPALPVEADRARV
jgi:hypothetical protein